MDYGLGLVFLGCYAAGWIICLAGAALITSLDEHQGY